MGTAARGVLSFDKQPLLALRSGLSGDFSAGHMAAGDFRLVFVDIATIFIDALIYAVIYK